MNYKDACNILNLNTNFTIQQLKHNYFSLALKYHPDKNIGVDTTDKFQNIQAAYTYLSNIDITENVNSKDNQDNSYSALVKDFLNGVISKNLDTDKFINMVNKKCSDITIDLFKSMPKTTILHFQSIAQQYSDILNINPDILEKLDNIAKQSTKNDIIINLSPTLSNLLNDEVYKYIYNDETYYIPYWHHELIYDLSQNSLIFQCEPSLPECAFVDKYNNLYISINSNITDIISNATIDVNISSKIFKIPVDQLKIKKHQIYTFKYQGIAQINTKDIYDIKTRGHIFINITFNDL